MRFILAASSLVLMSTASFAAVPVITEHIDGTIGGSNTVDTKGYFGKAGADLTGVGITIYVQYVPKLFGASQTCSKQACTYNLSGQKGDDVQGSLLITVYVNGRRVVYSPIGEGGVTFSTQDPYQFTADADAIGGHGIGLAGIEVGLLVGEAPTFGQPLSPRTPPVHNVTTDYVDFFTDSDQAPGEQLSFSVFKAIK